MKTWFSTLVVACSLIPAAALAADAPKNWTVSPGQSIQDAIDKAAPGDTVLLAGRGHETTIPLDGQKLPFHDPTVARELLAGGC